MSSESLAIDPYLGPAYWANAGAQHTIGDGDSEAARRHPANLMAWCGAVSALRAYVKGGASRVALSQLNPGDEFNVEAYPPGTIIMTACEQLWTTPASGQPENYASEADPHTWATRQLTVHDPMEHFSHLDVPHRSTIYDGEIGLTGRGYSYLARPLLSVIVDTRRGCRRVYSISNKLINNRTTYATILGALEQTALQYVVGQTYHFGKGKGEVLARVNQFQVCANGNARRRRRRAFKWLPHLKPVQA